MKHFYGNFEFKTWIMQRKYLYTLRFEVKWNARRFKES